MSNFKMPSAYHPSNFEWVRPIESLTSDGARELQRLKAENAKLRELVRDLREHIESDDGFGPDIGWMLNRMRELGVIE